MTRTQAMMSCRHWLWAVLASGKGRGQRRGSGEGGRSTRTQRRSSRGGAAEQEQQRRRTRGRWQVAVAGGRGRRRRCDKRHARARRRHFQLSAFRSRRMHMNSFLEDGRGGPSREGRGEREGGGRRRGEAQASKKQAARIQVQYAVPGTPRTPGGPPPALLSCLGFLLYSPVPPTGRLRPAPDSHVLIREFIDC